MKLERSDRNNDEIRTRGMFSRLIVSLLLLIKAYRISLNVN